MLIVVFLGGIGWQMWKLHLYNNAVRQAKESGFDWKCDDTISLIRQDWRNALKKETWGHHHRVLVMKGVRDLGRYREMLHRLRPTELSAFGCENLDVLKDITSLQSLIFADCPALQNMDVLKGFTGLQKLHLQDCKPLQSVDCLKSLTNLQELRLMVCDELLNVDGLKGLTGLQFLGLDDSDALQNVDALKTLTSLQSLELRRCNKIPATALRELRAALPKTDITFPDGTKNPPQ